MKMRKLLPLVLLAIGAIFLLSSCDQLLDSIYPNNTITVTVAVNGTSHPDWSLSPVYITLGGAAATPTLYANATVYSVGWAYYYFPSFTKLPNGNYTITAQYYGTSASYYEYVSLSMPFNGSNSADVTVTFP